MTIYFFDTSALLKRYVAEVGSDWVQRTLTEPENDPVISQITSVEVVAALTRRGKNSTLKAQDIARALQQAEADINTGFLIIEVNADVVSTAVKLAKRHALQGYDALQLAAASTIFIEVDPEPVIFVSADDELNAAAIAEGLTTINPNLVARLGH